MICVAATQFDRTHDFNHIFIVDISSRKQKILRNKKSKKPFPAPRHSNWYPTISWSILSESVRLQSHISWRKPAPEHIFDDDTWFVGERFVCRDNRKKLPAAYWFLSNIDGLMTEALDFISFIVIISSSLVHSILLCALSLSLAVVVVVASTFIWCLNGMFWNDTI